MRKATLLLTLLPLTSAALAQQESERSVLFILVDDMQRHVAGYTGNSEVITPNIDNIARRGTIFNHCHTNGANQSALSMPSRAMLMTGCTLYELTKDGLIIDPSTPTLPEQLREKGYRTFATGKWHSDYASFTRSFSEGAMLFFGGMHPYHSGGHTKALLKNYDPTGNYEEQESFVAKEFSSKVYTDAILEFLASTEDNKKPFFAYVAYTSPHYPRGTHPDYAPRPDESTITLPPNFAPQHPFDNGDLNARDELCVPAPRSKETIKKELANYYGMVNEVDFQIGRLLKAIEGRDDIIVIFASDNGLAIGQHGLVGKQNLYEHSSGVPLIISSKEFSAGGYNTNLCYISDIAPTLRDMLDVEQSETAAGISLLNREQKRQNLPLMYSNIQRAIIELPYKYIIYSVNGTTTEQMYNIEDDRWEINNLLENPTPQMRKKANELRDTLGTELEKAGEPESLKLGTHSD